MRTKHFSLITFSLCLLILLFYGCGKEDTMVDNTTNARNQVTELEPINTACTPYDLFPDSTSNCSNSPRAEVLDFSLGLQLYSVSSLLHQICPEIQFSVSYTYATCIFNGRTIHYVYNISYNLIDIISACPALQTQINWHTTYGDLTTILDQIDDDISREIEFLQLYNEAIKSGYAGEYDCSPMGVEYYDIKIIKSSCYSWIPYTEPTNTPVPAYKKVPCNDNVCCIRVGQYCVGGFYDGEPVIQGSSNSSQEISRGACPISCTHECGHEPGGPTM